MKREKTHLGRSLFDLQTRKRLCWIYEVLDFWFFQTWIKRGGGINNRKGPKHKTLFTPPPKKQKILNEKKKKRFLMKFFFFKYRFTKQITDPLWDWRRSFQFWLCYMLKWYSMRTIKSIFVFNNHFMNTWFLANIGSRWFVFFFLSSNYLQNILFYFIYFLKKGG